MSDNKKYYYLKIKDNFFDTDDMKILESMDNGYLYSNILMKLYLKSLKGNGRLMFKDTIPYNSKMLATITGHDIDHIEKAITIFQDLNMIDILDNGAIYMIDIENYIGNSTTEADRIRKYRSKKAIEKKEIVQMYDKCTPELELKLEIDINKVEKTFQNTSFKKWDIEMFKQSIRDANKDNDYDDDLRIAFYEHWTEDNGKGKFAFQLKDTWVTKSRLNTFKRNREAWKK